jgi:hypothetical protein
MEPAKFLPAPANDQILHVGPQAVRVLRWLTSDKLEVVSETSGGLYYRDDRHTGEEQMVNVEQHFIIGVSGNRTKILKAYAKNGA